MDASSLFNLVAKRLRSNLKQLGHTIPEDDIRKITSFFLDDIECAGFRLAPISPTKEMVRASIAATKTGVRMNERWVSTPKKHAWRLRAAIEASPPWKSGGTIKVSGQNLADAHSKSPSRPAMPKEEDTHG